MANDLNPDKKNVEKPAEQEPVQKADELILRLRQALEAKEGGESLHRVGDLMYETFKIEKYSPENVLSSVKEVYEKSKNDFDPKIKFNDFIRSFGPGLIKLCQQKLLAAGNYDLGKYGEKKDGVDGKLGRMTSKALALYFERALQGKGTEQAPVAVPKQEPPKTRTQPTLKRQPAPQNPIPELQTEPRPAPQYPPQSKAAPAKSYHEARPARPPSETHRAPNEPHKLETREKLCSSKPVIRKQVEALYGQYHTHFFNGYGGPENMSRRFGKTQEQVTRFLTDRDPLDPSKPLTFLGRRIGYGMNLMAIPFLKKAEEEIGLRYKPAAEELGGFEYRDMKIRSGKKSGLPSFHKFGLAIDIDQGNNGISETYKNPKITPYNNRGNIPDFVVLALVRAGFAWGAVEGKDFGYLDDDPMHFQLRVDTESEQGQEIINSSPLAVKYWRVIAPMLRKIEAA